jgi:hypothetical protein
MAFRAALAAVTLAPASAFYLPGVAPRTFRYGDRVCGAYYFQEGLGHRWRVLLEYLVVQLDMLFV